MAPIAGALTALVPLTIGGALWSADDQPSRQQLGTTLILAGFAAAPWVAHLGGRRPQRMIFFGLTALTASVATFVAMEVKDPFDPTLANPQRLAFGTLFSTSLLTAAVGIIDAFWEVSQPEAAP